MVKTPKFLGARMTAREDGSLFATRPELDVKLEVFQPSANVGWKWNLLTSDGEHVLSPMVPTTGPRAAAQAAERWLLTRAELTLRLASKRAA